MRWRRENDFQIRWDFFKNVEYPWSEIVTTRTLIKQDRDLVLRYMRALEGALYVQTRA
jgi:hypothetical protein